MRLNLFLKSISRYSICFIATFFMWSGVAFGQSLNSNWKKDLETNLKLYKDCKTANGEAGDCTNQAGELLKTVYRINDFYAKEEDRYMVAKEIATYLDGNKNWKKLGHAYEQNALSQAQDLANGKKAVVAVYVDMKGDGHVSIVLPGELVTSGTWGFQVPNSTSFFVHDPEKSYVGKGLSYAFTPGMLKNVILYARSY